MPSGFNQPARVHRGALRRGGVAVRVGVASGGLGPEDRRGEARRRHHGIQ